jgi:hypothetical protein
MKMTFRFFATLALVFAATLGAWSTTARAAPVNLVTNGDFSTGDFTGWTVFGADDVGYVFLDQFAVLTAGTGYGYLQQDLNVTPGHTYQFGFRLGWSLLTPDQFTAWADVDNGPALLDLIDVASPDENAPIEWHSYVYLFTATSNSTTIGFRFINPPTAWSLDDVFVTPVSTPIPAAGLMLLTGLVPLAALARSKARSVRKSVRPRR